MSLIKANQLGFLAGLTVLALGLAQGCSSGDDSQAMPPAAGAGGKSGGAGSSGKSGSGNGNAPGAGGEAGAPVSPSGGDSGAAGAPPAGGDSGAAGASPANCDGPDGCYSCTPTTPDQFANHCVTGGCPAHFDNTKLSKLALVGSKGG